MVNTDGRARDLVSYSPVEFDLSVAGKRIEIQMHDW